MPPYWELRPPLNLEVAAETEEERRQLKAYEAVEARDWYRAKRLYARARAAHELISPILHAEDQLYRELADYAANGADITDTRCLRALMRFRYALANYTVHPNPAVDAYLFQFDQKLDRIRDAARREILRRLFGGKCTTEQRREFIEVLEADAASGAWADPEGDLAWAEAQVG